MLYWMLVPMPRKMKEMRKTAESSMATSLTQKLSLSRFIIMAVYPPRSSSTETIVYHVAPDYRGNDPTTCRGLDDVPRGISALERCLDQYEVGPFTHFERPGLDAERPRPTQGRQLQTPGTAYIVQIHRKECLLEEVHAGATPEPVGAHPDPDSAFDHVPHGRDAAREEIVRPGAVCRGDAGPSEDLDVLFRDPRRQVGGYRLWGEEPYVPGV